MKLSFNGTRVIPLLWIPVLVIYALAAYLNMGYFHPDEHYQIIEFAGLKLGWNRPQDLAWEYSTVIRPTIQPWLCILIFKILYWLGIKNPYSLALALRLITAGCAVFVIRFFANKSYDYFRLTNFSKLLYDCCCYFLWFIPLVSVRFSSETWSGLLFTVAFTLMLYEKNYFLTGLLLGACFLFRFQCGILAGCLFLWLLIIHKTPVKNLLLLLAGGVLMVILGIWLDYLFYDYLSLTFVNYFRINILEGYASHFGVSPWSDVLDYLIFHPLFPFGLLIFGSCLWLLIIRPIHILTWCLIPFIVIHALIPHKEVRFLFPVVWLLPCVVFVVLDDLYQRYFRHHIHDYKLVINILFTLLVVLNSFALLIGIIKPAGQGQKYMTSNIDEKLHGRPAILYYTFLSNPYQPWESLPEHFYKNDNVQYRYVSNINTLDLHHINDGCEYLLAIHEFEKEEVDDLLKRGKIKVKSITMSMPVIEWPFISRYVGYNKDAHVLLYSF